MSVSAEAGWRFDVMKNVFFEPQVEVWYGHVFDAQYETSTGVDVDLASTDSLVGRAGFRLGLECPNNRGSAFIKASVLHGWKGEADFRFTRAASLPERSRKTWAARGMSTASAPTSMRPNSSTEGRQVNRRGEREVPLRETDGGAFGFDRNEERPARRSEERRAGLLRSVTRLCRQGTLYSRLWQSPQMFTPGLCSLWQSEQAMSIM